MAANADRATTVSRELRDGHVDSLVDLLVILKALSSPPRLALVGHLASRPTVAVPLDELGRATGLPAERIRREVPVLTAAGIVRLHEPTSDEPGTVVSLAVDERLASQLQAAIGPLTMVIDAARPKAPAPRDERSQTLARFFRDGELVSWPSHPRRVRYVLEEIAERFPPGQRMPERDVDAELRRVFPADHCTLRRALVDANLLNRADDIYWRPTPPATHDTASPAR